MGGGKVLFSKQNIWVLNLIDFFLYGVGVFLRGLWTDLRCHMTKTAFHISLCHIKHH